MGSLKNRSLIKILNAVKIIDSRTNQLGSYCRIDYEPSSVNCETKNSTGNLFLCTSTHASFPSLTGSSSPLVPPTFLSPYASFSCISPHCLFPVNCETNRSTGNLFLCTSTHASFPSPPGSSSPCCLPHSSRPTPSSAGSSLSVSSP